ncbi:MAG: PilZ domain-containing protein [Xanthobacteraceae bacterium]
MPREKRKHRRRQLERSGWIRLGDGSSVYCVIKDVSDAGAKLSGGGVQEAPDYFVLSFSPDHKVTRGCRVIRRAEGEIAVRFTAAGH